MGQTIICEYLAAWEDTGTQPDPIEYGFDGMFAMLQECQSAMLELGESVNAQRYRANGLRAEYDALSDRAVKLKKELDDSDKDWQAILDNERRTVAIAKELISELEARCTGVASARL